MSDLWPWRGRWGFSLGANQQQPHHEFTRTHSTYIKGSCIISLPHNERTYGRIFHRFGSTCSLRDLHCKWQYFTDAWTGACSLILCPTLHCTRKDITYFHWPHSSTLLHSSSTKGHIPHRYHIGTCITHKHKGVSQGTHEEIWGFLQRNLWEHIFALVQASLQAIDGVFPLPPSRPNQKLQREFWYT